jgi:hypothetical protein
MSMTNSRFKYAAALTVVAGSGFHAASASAFTPPLQMTSYSSTFQSAEVEHVFVLPATLGWNDAAPTEYNSAGLYQFVCSSKGCWQEGYAGTAICTDTNCPNGAQVAMPHGTPILGYYNPRDSDNHIFYINNDGHLHEWYWPETGDLSNYDFNGVQIDDRDLTVETSTPPPLVTFNSGYVQTATTITGFVDSSNISHVFFTDAYHRLHELYNNGSWWGGGPTSAQANATNGQGLTSLWDGSTTMLYFTGLDGNLWNEWLLNGTWKETQITGTGGALNLSTAQAPNGFLSALLPTSSVIIGTEGSGPSARAVAATAIEWATEEFTGNPALSVNSPTIGLPGNDAAYWVYAGTDQNLYIENLYSTNGPAVSIESQYGGPKVSLTAGGSQLTPITGFYDGGTSGNYHIFYISQLGGTNSPPGGALFEDYSQGPLTSDPVWIHSISENHGNNPDTFD